MFAAIAHKLGGGGQKCIVISSEKAIRLKSKVSLIINIRQSFDDGIPVDAPHAREGVIVAYIAHVMDMKRAQAIVTKGTDGILGLAATKGYVADIETYREQVGAVLGIVVGGQLLGGRGFIIASVGDTYLLK